VALPRRTTRPRFVLISVVLLSLTLLVLDLRGFAPLDKARDAVLSVAAPVGGASSRLFRPVGDAWSGAFSGAELQRENDELRRKVEDLQGQIAQSQAAQSELDKLKQALDLPYAGSLARVTAQVTSGAIADFDATIDIDKGSDEGIAKGMPVVVDSGVVGVVVRVSPDSSVVRLATDRMFRAGVNVAGSVGRGIVEGGADDRTVKASQFDSAVDLPIGSLLVTAGTPGSVFPAGLPVGTIESVAVDEATHQKTADVRLATRVDDLLFVTVLLYRSP
jgi:rod shape-determining protein MreC